MTLHFFPLRGQHFPHTHSKFYFVHTFSFFYAFFTVLLVVFNDMLSLHVILKPK